jgi:hypothetical protein
MNILNLYNIKKNGVRYILVNLLTIFIFSILYLISDIIDMEKATDPWYYWLYFSSITQTTVGYSGIQIKGKPGINIMTLKSKYLKVTVFLQLLSIIIINGFFLYI